MTSHAWRSEHLYNCLENKELTPEALNCETIYSRSHATSS
jgi:hypothetical protein